MLPDLATDIPGVELRELTARDAAAFHALVAGNREHLTRLGDYEELASSTLADLEAYFANPPDRNLRMGITHGNEKSAAVARRLGFSIHEELPTRTRYRLA